MLGFGPSSSNASRCMARVRQTGTNSESALRREIYRIGLRYRIGYEVLNKRRCAANVAFLSSKTAVLFDGCFWHSCSNNVTWPKLHADIWWKQITANRKQNACTTAQLEPEGWRALQFWLRESPIEAVNGVARLFDIANTMHGAWLPGQPMKSRYGR